MVTVGGGEATWATDSRILRACEVLDWTSEQAYAWGQENDIDPAREARLISYTEISGPHPTAKITLAEIERRYAAPAPAPDPDA